MSREAAAAGLLRLARALDPLAWWSGRLVAWLIVPMVLGLTYEVVARYVFSAPTLWAYDMTFMLYGAFFMLGAAFTLQRKAHIRTDSLYGDWSPRRQGWVDAVCYVVMFLPVVTVFLWYGWGYFLKSLTTGERFVSSPWMPVAWPFKAVMPLTGLLLAVQGLAEFCRSLFAILTGRWPTAEEAPLAQPATPTVPADIAAVAPVPVAVPETVPTTPPPRASRKAVPAS